jgi:hypothetical protein
MRSGIAVGRGLVVELPMIGQSELEAYCNEEGEDCDSLLCARHDGRSVRVCKFRVYVAGCV